MDVLAMVLLFMGIALELIAVLGVCVMRDPLDSLHCISLVSYGVLLVAVAVLVNESFSLIGNKALLTGVLVAGAGPVVVHTTARSLCTRFWGDWTAHNSELRKHDRES